VLGLAVVARRGGVAVATFAADLTHVLVAERGVIVDTHLDVAVEPLALALHVVEETEQGIGAVVGDDADDSTLAMRCVRRLRQRSRPPRRLAGNASL